MLKIWGRLSSVNVQKVAWCVAELGIAHQRIDAGRSFGIVDTPDYRAKNPNGLVPCIDDDGFVLWESNAIVRYLAARYGEGSLCPRDPRERADADRWMDWQATTFNPALSPAFTQLVRTAAAEHDAGAVEKSRALTEQKLAILDAHLATHAFVTGDAFTMADIPLGCSVMRWMKLPLARAAHPHVERWHAALVARPAASEVAALPLT